MIVTSRFISNVKFDSRFGNFQNVGFIIDSSSFHNLHSKNRNIEVIKIGITII